MKYLIITIALFMHNYSAADEKIAYNLHLASYHFNRDFEWNEENYGLGIEYGGDEYIGIGYFKNSYNNDTFYALVGKDVKAGPIKVGVFAGVASGYKNRQEYAPLVAGIRAIYGNVNILLTPSNFGLSLHF